MKVVHKVRINKALFGKMNKLAGESALRMTTSLGVFYVRGMAAATNPHNGKLSVNEVLKVKNSADIIAAREKVALNIAGVANVNDIEAYARPVPYSNLAGAWLALDPASGKRAQIRGDFGMIVPTSWARVRGIKPPEVSPESLYRGAVWDGKKMKPKRWRKGFVKKDALKKFVKEKQAHVGKLVSGWAPAAHLFASGGIAKGFFAELQGKGSGRKWEKTPGEWKGKAINSQPYNAGLARQIESRARGMIRRAKEARKAQAKAIMKWFAREIKKAVK